MLQAGRFVRLGEAEMLLLLVVGWGAVLPKSCGRARVSSRVIRCMLATWPACQLPAGGNSCMLGPMTGPVANLGTTLTLTPPQQVWIRH